MRFAAIAALAIIATACSRNDDAPQSRPVVTASANNVSTQVSGLTDRQRNAVFIRAIRDAGLECQHVDWSTLYGTFRGMPVWTAACARNQVWVIVVRNDGVAQILNPTDGLRVYNEIDRASGIANGQ